MGAFIAPILDIGSKLIDRIFPDKAKQDEAKLKLLELQQAGEFKAIELEYTAMAQQAAVNLKEAESGSWWVSGWRPYIGWVCGTGVGYQVILRPLLISCGVPAPPVDVAVIIELLVAMLGLGGLRTAEKFKGVASK
jgi:Holin of 3TMs, for gene-transfer release